MDTPTCDVTLGRFWKWIVMARGTFITTLYGSFYLLCFFTWSVRMCDFFVSGNEKEIRINWIYFLVWLNYNQIFALSIFCGGKNQSDLSQVPRRHEWHSYHTFNVHCPLAYFIVKVTLVITIVSRLNQYKHAMTLKSQLQTHLFKLTHNV